MNGRAPSKSCPFEMTFNFPLQNRGEASSPSYKEIFICGPVQYLGLRASSWPHALKENNTYTNIYKYKYNIYHIHNIYVYDIYRRILCI